MPQLDVKNPFLLGFGHLLKQEKSMLLSDGQGKDLVHRYLTEQLHVSPQTFRGFESANKFPSRQTMPKIASSFDFNYSRLVTFLCSMELIGKEFDDQKAFEKKAYQSMQTLNDSLLSYLIMEGIEVYFNEDDYSDHRLHKLAMLIADYLRVQKRFTERHTFSARFARFDELTMIHDWWVELIPEVKPLISPGYIEAFYQINPQIATLVFDNKKNKVGFYLLFPLNPMGLDYRIQCAKGIINSTEGSKPEHISPTFKEAKGIWIGMVAGNNQHAAGHIIEIMMAHFKPLFFNHQLEAVMTRGMTSKGKNAMKRRGFQSIQRENSIESSGVSILPVNEQWLEAHNIQRMPTVI